MEVPPTDLPAARTACSSVPGSKSAKPMPPDPITFFLGFPYPPPSMFICTRNSFIGVLEVPVSSSLWVPRELADFSHSDKLLGLPGRWEKQRKASSVGSLPANWPALLLHKWNKTHTTRAQVSSLNLTSEVVCQHAYYDDIYLTTYKPRRCTCGSPKSWRDTSCPRKQKDMWPCLWRTASGGPFFSFLLWNT